MHTTLFAYTASITALGLLALKRLHLDGHPVDGLRKTVCDHSGCILGVLHQDEGDARGSQADRVRESFSFLVSIGDKHLLNGSIATIMLAQDVGRLKAELV